jgi:hypothetical protein
MRVFRHHGKQGRPGIQHNKRNAKSSLFRRVEDDRCYALLLSSVFDFSCRCEICERAIE